MSARVRVALVLLILAGLPGGVALPAAGGAQAPNVPWPDLVPALPTVANPQPGPQPGCPRATLACLDYEIQRMRAAQDGFRCDHRAVFATTYLVLTETLRATLRQEPAFFADREFLIYEDALFAHLYFRTLEDRAAGRPVPEAWRIAFDAAASGELSAAQDMLLGINAHVQRDMPYVLAALGLHRPDGSTRKLDHDRFNEVLNRAYGPVVTAITRRYDPNTSTTNPNTPADNLAGLELVKVWRENVWRNAERLLNATTAQDRSAVQQSIESDAAASAQAIARPQQPAGYRAQRDAYCAAHVPAATSAPVPAGRRPAPGRRTRARRRRHGAHRPPHRRAGHRRARSRRENERE